MSRGVVAATQTQLESDSQRGAALVSIALTSGTVYYTNHGFPITYDSNTYQRTGPLIDIDQISEKVTIGAEETRIRLDGANQTFTAIALGGVENIIGVEVQILLAMLDENNAVAGEPIELFSGQIIDVEYDETDEESDSNAYLTLVCSDEWADFEKTNGRRTSSNSQQSVFPRDIGMQYAGRTNRDLRWGRE